MKAVTKKIDGIEFEVNGEIRVTSFEIAEHFDKEPKHINEIIAKLIKKDVPFFRPISIEDKYKRDRSGYDMNRDGYSLLVMGFSGDKALSFKLKFIRAFNKMEERIDSDRQRSVHDNMARLECPAMTLALKETRLEDGKDTKPHHYSNEHNLIYRIILGVTKKKWCDDNDIDLKDRFRDHLPTPMIEAVEELQRVNTSMIEMGFDYQARKVSLDKLYTKKYLNRCLQAIVDDNA